MVVRYEPQANKSFSVQQFFKNAAEVWASSPHLRSKLDLQQVFLMQLHFLKLTNSQLIIFIKQVTNSDKATGQLQHAGRQKQGWNPLLPDGSDRFPKEQILLRKTTCVQFGKAGAHPQLAFRIAIAPETLHSHYNLSILKAIAILPILS